MKKPINITNYRFAVNVAGTLSPHRNQRCYSNASLYADVANILRNDKVLPFKVNPGIITCQSDKSRSDLLQIIVSPQFPAERHRVERIAILNAGADFSER